MVRENNRGRPDEAVVIREERDEGGRRPRSRRAAVMPF